MPTNKLNSSEIKNSLPPLPNPELTRLFYHAIMTELSSLKEEIGDYTAKEIVFNALDRIPEVKVEWGNNQVYGRNRILLGYADKIAVLDITPIMQSIKLVWNTYYCSQNL